MEYYKFTHSNNDLKNKKLCKSKTFSNKIIMVNGFNASGKTAFSPLVSSIKDVEVMSFAYEVEWCSSFLYSNEISMEAYVEFIKMYVDLKLYNQMMSREVNFRWKDLSSVIRHKSRWTYIKRLFKSGDNAILDNIKNGNPIVSLTTCHLMPFIPALTKALQERLLFIEVVRDPMFMFHQLLILQETIIKGHPEKDFTTRVRSNGVDATYLEYYSSIEVFDEIKNANNASIVVGYLERVHNFYRTLDIENLEINNSSFMLIPFEKFVLTPKKWMESIVEFSGSVWSEDIDKEMIRQKVPRKLLGAGRNLEIYKRFGWTDELSKKNITLVEENEKYRMKMKVLIDDDDLYERLENISDGYKDWIDSISNFTFPTK